MRVFQCVFDMIGERLIKFLSFARTSFVMENKFTGAPL